MEPSSKKRKLAPKITSQDPASPSAINSSLHATTASYPAEPQYPVQDAAAAAAAAALASNSERHDFESFARHLQDAAMLIQRQAERQAEILASTKVSVLLLRWADDPTASADIDALEHTFQKCYRFHTQRWLIPSDSNPLLKLLQHVACFLENAPRNHLIIIYYAGYGFVTSDDQLYWASNARNDAAKVKWDGVRCLLEDTMQDVLLLLDTCALPDIIPSGRHGVKQGIAACTPERMNRQEGPSFTSCLNGALKKLGRGRPFSVQRLLEEIQGQKNQHSSSESPTAANGNPSQSLSTTQPVFFTLARGNGQYLTLSPPSGQAHMPHSPGDANGDANVSIVCEDKAPESEDVHGLRFDEARVLVCTTFVGEASADMGFYNKWLQSPPASASNIILEGMFLGPPTMLLISMPHSVWTVVQHDQVCCYLGFINSHNMLHLYQRLVSTGDAQPWAKKVEAGTMLLDTREVAGNAPARVKVDVDGHSPTLSRNSLSSKDHRGFHAINSSPGSSFNTVKPKDEVQDSAEMQEAAEQLKALSHVRTRSDEGIPAPHVSGDRQRTTLPDSIPDVRRQEHSRPLPDSADPALNDAEIQTSPGPRLKAPRRALPKQESRCNHCTHAPFKDSTALRKHILAAHTRPFPCAFSFAGCNSTFGSKNEWKRHIASQHLCLTYYRCSSCSKTTVDGKGNEFNRKDLFTQHLRRMHAPHDIRRALQKGEAKSEEEWDARVRELQQSCLVVRRKPPQRSACPKEGCSMTFEGHSAWDDWTEHVGRHMEKGEAQRLGVDKLLTKWALDEGVIEAWGDGEYRLTAGSSVGGGPYANSWPSERHAHARRRSSATAYSADKSSVEGAKTEKVTTSTIPMDVDNDV